MTQDHLVKHLLRYFVTNLDTDYFTCGNFFTFFLKAGTGSASVTFAVFLLLLLTDVSPFTG